MPEIQLRPLIILRLVYYSPTGSGASANEYPFVGSTLDNYAKLYCLRFCIFNLLIATIITTIPN